MSCRSFYANAVHWRLGGVWVGGYRFEAGSWWICFCNRWVGVRSFVGILI